MLTVGMTMAQVDWKMMLSISLVIAIYSLLTSIITDLPEAQKSEGTIWIGNNTVSGIDLDTDVSKLTAKKLIMLHVNKHEDK
jgi:hypothetical protein